MSDEQKIHHILETILHSMPTKDVAAMEAVSHPQGALVTMMNGEITARPLYQHLAAIADFPGVPGETINEGSLEIKIVGEIAVATFETIITSDAVPLLRGQNAVVFHKCRMSEGAEETWKLTFIGDNNAPA